MPNVPPMIWNCRWSSLCSLQPTALQNPRSLGATAANTLVLHTWTQDLRLHLHAHAVMACGGLAEQGYWVVGGG